MKTRKHIATLLKPTTRREFAATKHPVLCCTCEEEPVKRTNFTHEYDECPECLRETIAMQARGTHRCMDCGQETFSRTWYDAPRCEPCSM